MSSIQVDPAIFAQADCQGTERAWSGGPSQPVNHQALRLKPEARLKRPKQAPLFAYTSASNAYTQKQQGYQEIRDKTWDSDLLHGAYDRTVIGRAMPGSLRLGVNADAYPGLPQMRNYEPKYTIKAERVGEIMRPLGAKSISSDSVNGYSLLWRPKTYKRGDQVIQELDPQVQLANLARNPLAGPLPMIQRTDVRFQTGCDTIPMCAMGDRFCQSPAMIYRQ